MRLLRLGSVINYPALAWISSRISIASLSLLILHFAFTFCPILP
jgi:hypothetical protein